jgi:8-amino-7-oxononanoate synthase
MVKWANYIAKRYESLLVLRPRILRLSGNARYLTTKTKKHLNFISNDYLGLSTNTKIVEAFNMAANVYGLGSTGAPTLSGYTEEHDLLSSEIASWLGFNRCLLFNSGFQLNVGIYSQLVDSDTMLWLDRNCHASHIDGILLSKAKFSSFTDANIDSMIDKIKLQTDKRHLILTEGSFSMDGTCSYLNKLLQLKKSSPDNVLLIIDDAHGVGALGENGFGTLEQLGLQTNDIDLFIGTFGKAFGTHGGFICGNENLIEYLQQSVRSQIYSTNLPPSIAAATRKSLEIIKSDEGRALRKRLRNNISYFSSLTDKNSPNFTNYQNGIYNQSPIQLLIFSDSNQLDAIHTRLFDNNILVGKIKYPTVPKDKPRLRISLNALQPNQDLDFLIEQINSMDNIL